jgi:hypothetical protein
MSSSDLGCAVRSDGTLKDASEIDWSFDRDDDDSPSLSSGPSAAAQVSGPSGPELHPFFSGTLRPATFAAGFRRSGRATRPSNRIADPDNAMGVTAVAAGKRKSGEGQASSNKSTRNVKPKKSTYVSVPSEDEEDGDGNYIAPAPTEVPTDVDEDIEEAEDADDEEYETLKAMADADHKGSAFSFSYRYSLTLSSHIGNSLQNQRRCDSRCSHYISPGQGAQAS